MSLAPFGRGIVQHRMWDFIEPADRTHRNDADTDATPSPKESKKTRHKEITALARAFSGQSEKSGTTITSQTGINTFINRAADRALDPFDGQFNSEAWVKNLLAMNAHDPERYPRRTAGVTFSNLNVSGYGTATDYQTDFTNVLLKCMDRIRTSLGLVKRRRIDILRDFEGIVRAGEMVVVLGRPGSGCSTLLKTIAGETHGLFLGEGSAIHYDGIAYHQMHQLFRGEAIYQTETEIHLPHLTVGDTLLFEPMRARRETDCLT